MGSFESRYNSLDTKMPSRDSADTRQKLALPLGIIVSPSRYEIPFVADTSLLRACTEPPPSCLCHFPAGLCASRAQMVKTSYIHTRMRELVLVSCS
jgi:hypothetical protein